ncbi:hypothetical protein EGI16_21275 [Chryseobacterium sp. G0240]|nr:hypothetical protein EGI16_21275 [Chryseobacterium sp. G0240]
MFPFSVFPYSYSYSYSYSFPFIIRLFHRIISLLILTTLVIPQGSKQSATNSLNLKSGILVTYFLVQPTPSPDRNAYPAAGVGKLAEFKRAALARGV